MLSLAFSKVAGLQPISLYSKRNSQTCFPMESAKHFVTVFFEEHLRVTASVSLQVIARKHPILLS